MDKSFCTKVKKAVEPVGENIKVAVILLFLGIMAGPASAATLTVDDSGGANYTRIQDAINNASAGDTILVYSGTYFENVNVNKRLILRGIGMPVVDARGSGRAITLAADGIILEGFTATKATTGISVTSNNNTLIGNNANSNTGYYRYSGYGIYLDYSSNNTLIGNNANSNTASNTGYGIYLDYSSNNTLIGNNANSNTGYVGYGIYLSSSSNNTLNGNNANSNTEFGIYLSLSSNNTLTGNNANSNTLYGISLASSNNNTLSGNNASSNTGNVGYGISLSSSNNNTLSENNASSNTGYVGYGIYLDSSSNNMLSGNNASLNNGIGSSGTGIYLYSSSNNTLIGNNASSNIGCCGGEGIFMYLSSNNTLIGNNASSNTEFGIYLSSSSNNRIYNNIFNNTNNVQFYSPNINSWNTTLQFSPNIIGGPTLGGNFWAYPNGTGFSQSCTDADKDGICDAQYTLDTNNIDHLPLAYKPIISDAISPVINSVTLNTTTPLTGQAILVIVNATDNVGVTNMVANGASLTVQGGNTFTWSGTITALEGTHSVNVSAVDAENNVAWNNSTSYTATTPTVTNSISGYKINDTNGNGKWDAGEAGIQGWNITLKNATTGEVIASNLTDNNGFYKFTSIANGSYNVTEEIRAGFTPTNATFKLVNVADQNVMNMNFTNQPPGSNLIQNSGFESGTSPWIFYTNGTGKFTAESPGYEGSKSAKIVLYTGGTNIQLYQKGISLEPHTRYRLSFAAYSTRGHDLKVQLIKHVSPYTVYGLYQTFNLSASWQEFSTEFTTTGFSGTVNDGRLMFFLAPYAKAGDTYYIDDVWLEKI